MSPAKPQSPSFKGNKSYLPSKPCAVCGRDMSWRKAWANHWEQVKYCSEACRKRAKPGAA
ncbi:DUF2256 domain-containing protein [Methylobacillus flagellatus]|uniref:DUF2256 domain-containing protein n=1 Tax=Methylobacillus flagellatus TaxID=405 RepID=UPI0010F8FBB4|nr:DUF2256 domain-containing protein [Methylobacillus flagellatus]